MKRVIFGAFALLCMFGQVLMVRSQPGRQLSFRHMNEASGFVNPWIMDIVEGPEGFIWFATQGGGLYRYDGLELHPYMTNYLEPNSLSDNNLHSLLVDEAGMIWMSTETGLNRMNPYKDEFTVFKRNARAGDPSLPLRRIYHIFQDTETPEILWLGGDGGLVSLHKSDFSWEVYVVNEKEGPVAFDENQVKHILQDRRNPQTLWLGTDHGLIRFDKQSHVFTSVPSPYTEGMVWDHLKRPRQLAVRHIYQDPQGILWIGSIGGGIFRYDPVSRTWNQYKYEEPDDPEHVLSDNNVSMLLPDRDQPHIFWFTGRRVFGTFNSQTLTYNLYYPDPNDPGSVMDSDYEVIYMDRNGKLWIGSFNGVSYTVDPVGSPLKARVFQPVLTGFQVRGERIRTDLNISFEDTINLPYEHRAPSFTLAVPNTPYPEKVEYAYQHASWVPFTSKEWKVIPAGTRVQLDKLLGGTHVLSFKARPEHGDWGPAGKVVLEVEVPYWQKWWFYALIFTSIASLSFGIFSYHASQAKEKAAIKAAYDHQLKEMEMSALRAQMNPHFLFNSLNSIKHFIIKNNPKEASRYLSKFSLLMRLILQNSQKPTVILSDELKALQLYMELESLRFDHKFDFHIELDEAVEADHIAIPPLILQPYVENAIWHGLMHKEEPGKIDIQVMQSGESLRITIQDNGIGRERAQAMKSKSALQRKSFGMQITSDRLALVETVHNIQTTVSIQDLYAPDGSPEGTRVEVRIPVTTTPQPKDYV